MKKETVLIQELDMNGRPREGVAPKKMTLEQWEKIKSRKLAKRFKEVQPKAPAPKKINKDE